MNSCTLTEFPTDKAAKFKCSFTIHTFLNCYEWPQKMVMNDEVTIKMLLFKKTLAQKFFPKKRFKMGSGSSFTLIKGLRHLAFPRHRHQKALACHKRHREVRNRLPPRQLFPHPLLKKCYQLFWESKVIQNFRISRNTFQKDWKYFQKPEKWLLSVPSFYNNQD